jgi:hypothetical protein
MTDAYCTIRDVARTYKVRPEMVRQRCREGVLEGAIHARRQWRIPAKYSNGGPEQEKESVSIFSHNRGNHNTIIVLAPVIIMGGGFVVLVLVISMLVFFLVNRAGFYAFMPHVFTGTFELFKCLFILALAGVAIKFVLGGFIQHVIVPLVHDVFGPFRTNRVHHANDNYTVYQDKDSMKVSHHEDNRYSYNIKQLEAPQEPVALIEAPRVHQPTQEEAISLLEYNKLQVCLGADKEVGGYVFTDLAGGSHFRNIGSSDMGKSCLASSIFDQATSANDEDHLRIALLDLECKASRLFETLPHVAELQIGRERVDCVAQSADEVGRHFGYLRQELVRRVRLSEYELRREMFLLIYLKLAA